MKKSHLMGVLVSVPILISMGIYFNGTWNRTSLDSRINQGNDRQTFPSIGHQNESDEDNTIESDLVETNREENYIHGNCEQIDDENHEHDEIATVPQSSEDANQEVVRTNFGYRLRGKNKNVIKWYLKGSNGRLLRRKIPINRKKIKLMRKVITDAVDKRFAGNDGYIDYPKVDERGNKTSVRLKRDDLINSLTLLEKMWESHGGDNYGTLEDKEGRKEKVFSPDLKKQEFRNKSVRFETPESYNDSVDDIPGGFTLLKRIDDFFINKAHASDSFGIPFTIFDHTWGNKSLIGFNGSLRGTFGAWGNVDDGGTMINGLSLNFSAYIFGKRKNFMSGSGHFQWDCPVEGNTSFARRMLVKKFSTKIYEKGGTEYLGRCELIHDGSGNNFGDSNGKQVNFDGIDACMKWRVFPGLKVKGCTGVKGSSGLNSYFKGGGSHSQGYIGSQQVLPYYGKAELALSPLGFDLASLSLNAQGKLIDLDNRLNVDLILQAGVSQDAQRAKLKVYRDILSGRIYLRLRWWSILDWDYKTWTKEIKPDGSLEKYNKTVDLLENI